MDTCNCIFHGETMPPKRERGFSLRFEEDEYLRLRRKSAEWNMDVSDIVRACIAIALPVMEDVYFVRRVQLEDNRYMRGEQ
jgi:hypothetical protein